MTLTCGIFLRPCSMMKNQHSSLDVTTGSVAEENAGARARRERQAR
jgi:hypothetical protein